MLFYLRFRYISAEEGEGNYEELLFRNEAVWEMVFHISKSEFKERIILSADDPYGRGIYTE